MSGITCVAIPLAIFIGIVSDLLQTMEPEEIWRAFKAVFLVVLAVVCIAVPVLYLVLMK